VFSGVFHAIFGLLTGTSFSSIHHPDIHFTVKLVTDDEKPGIRCFPASVFPEKAEGA
jgi:hypothetical protein